MIVSIEMIRPILATLLLASGAVVVVACSDDAKPVATTYPTQGDAGTGSSTSSTSSSGGSSGNVTKPDAGGPEPGNDAAAACAPLPADVDIHTVPTEPDPVGGAIMDGTYELTDAKQQDDAADGGVVGKKAATIVFSGKNVAWHFDRNTLGEPVDKCCVGTWSIINTVEINMGVTCGDGVPAIYEEPYDAIGEAGVPQIRLHYGGSIDTYTKK